MIEGPRDNNPKNTENAFRKAAFDAISEIQNDRIVKITSLKQKLYEDKIRVKQEDDKKKRMVEETFSGPVSERENVLEAIKRGTEIELDRLVYVYNKSLSEIEKSTVRAIEEIEEILKSQVANLYDKKKIIHAETAKDVVNRYLAQENADDQISKELTDIGIKLGFPIPKKK